MLNLLFITDSPKGEHIKSALQPVLKVIIDVVIDFDHGLKDVFEKRPATVCIQEQIGGVAGESVARHIQMLLGAGAPTFILLHEGNGKARQIKGLFEHLVDMSQPNDKVVEDALRILKSLLGTQWDKIYIPPKPTTSAGSPVVPEGVRNNADRHEEDDDIFDLETPGFPVADGQDSPFSAVSDADTEELFGTRRTETTLKPKNVRRTAEFDRAQSINDDLAEMLLMEENKGHREESPAAISADVNAPKAVSAGSPKSAAAVAEPSPTVVQEPPVSPGSTHVVRPAVFTAGEKSTKGVSEPAVRPQAVQAPPGAEFRINQHISSDEEQQLPENLLLAFEENYRSGSPFIWRAVVIVLVCVLCATGGWYLVKQKPQLVSLLKQLIMPSMASKPVPVAVQAPSPAPQKPVPFPIQPVVTPSLPAFIPKNGHDTSYAAKNPGWERYVGTNAEFRVFIASGHIRAVQALAVKDVSISESLIKSILQEFIGSSEYRIVSRSSKAGVHIENGKILNKGEVIFYRKNGAVKALVASVN